MIPAAAVHNPSGRSVRGLSPLRRFFGIVGLGGTIDRRQAPARPGQLVGVDVAEVVAFGLGFVALVGGVLTLSFHGLSLPGPPGRQPKGLWESEPGNALIDARSRP